MNSQAPEWRHDLEALQFDIGHGIHCMVHRLAFRSLIGVSPSMADCLAYYYANRAAFWIAARRRIEGGAASDGRNFHLDSRQVRCILTRQKAGEVRA